MNQVVLASGASLGRVVETDVETVAFGSTLDPYRDDPSCCWTRHLSLLQTRFAILGSLQNLCQLCPESTRPAPPCSSHHLQVRGWYLGSDA